MVWVACCDEDGLAFLQRWIGGLLGLDGEVVLAELYDVAGEHDIVFGP